MDDLSRGRNASQRGVALVITLLMLAVVTFMAVAFLTLSRRERGSVSVTQEVTVAKSMADMALARAQAETIARMIAQTNMAAYDFMVSTNYINQGGFNLGIATNPANGNYTYTNGQPLNYAHQIILLTNLYPQFDPRPPVFYGTNDYGTNDFRFYWDFNRNGRYESNGVLPEIDNLQRITGRTNFYVGDPEFIGVLDKLNLPHSPTNKFIGRYAYLALAAAKSLDLNFMHNQAKRPNAPPQDGYWRNQGVGSWELNLAAFLRDLNTNAWPTYIYNRALITDVSLGVAFDDATSLLRFRYDDYYGRLLSVSNLYGNNGIAAFRNYQIDGYSDGPLQTNLALPFNNDKPALPWSGSDNPRVFSDVQELFTQTNNPGQLLAFNQRLQGVMTNLGSYDRYTFYRLLSQMGVDSVPAWSNKVDINYCNAYGFAPTNFVHWPNAVSFFTNAAERLMRAQYGVSYTNVQVWPTNYYHAGIHRLLQLAVNIYDSTTNRFYVGTTNYYPSVFRPIFRKNTTPTNTFITIAGFSEVTSINDFNPPLDLMTNVAPNPGYRDYFRGIPFVVGAKKGLPNFNEASSLTDIMVSRKLEVSKPSLNALPNQTNILYLVAITNALGVECWNSYTQSYPRSLELQVSAQIRMVLTNQLGVVLWPRPNLPPLQPWNISVVTNLAATLWKSNQFVIPLNTNLTFIPSSVYLDRPPYFSTNKPAFANVVDMLNPSNQLILVMRASLEYRAIDTASGRLVDFVNLDNLVSTVNITSELMGPARLLDADESNLWNPVTGVKNQMAVSLGQMQSQWASYQGVGDKAKAIDKMLVFVGDSPLVYPENQVILELGNSLVQQAPYSASRRVIQAVSLQANDPLVHYTVEDLIATNASTVIKPPTNPRPATNLGQINDRYSPWGGNPGKDSKNDLYAYNPGFKDPLVRKSDDWDFPTNKYPNLGLIGRVHRGTPWQTVYLKSIVVTNNEWIAWAGRADTHPTNDWKLLQIFTTAANENAARGLLSVNQTNLAAWSAVLSGVSVLSNKVSGTLANNYAPTYNEMVIEPSSLQLSNIVRGIMAARARRPQQSFQYLGDIFSTPELTVASPYLFPTPEALERGIPDAVYERIPQQILSLLQEDMPRLAVYAYGQSLKPVQNAVILGGSARGLVTNYVVTSEHLTKTVFRIEGPPQNPQIVTESHVILYSD